jgi:hypothetical protein
MPVGSFFPVWTSTILDLSERLRTLTLDSQGQRLLGKNSERRQSLGYVHKG